MDDVRIRASFPLNGRHRTTLAVVRSLVEIALRMEHIGGKTLVTITGSNLSLGLYSSGLVEFPSSSNGKRVTVGTQTYNGEVSIYR